MGQKSEDGCSICRSLDKSKDLEKGCDNRESMMGKYDIL